MRGLLVIAWAVIFSGCEEAPRLDEERVGFPWIFSSPENWNEIQFGGEGSAQWNKGVLYLDAGVELTGAQYSGDLPAIPYELELEARKMSGNDFFCGLTFPVSSREECVTFIVGGWGGATVGISSVDGKDASENETTSYGSFESKKWYAIRIAVENERIVASIDGKEVVNLTTKGRALGLRQGSIKSSAPLGISAWQTAAEIRRVRWRSLAD